MVPWHQVAATLLPHPLATRDQAERGSGTTVTRLSTLKQFIYDCGYPLIGRGNAYVTYLGFRSLYVRYGVRVVPTVGHVSACVSPVLDLAVMEVAKPGRGTFTKFVETLRKDYPKLHLYIESVLNPRLGPHLKKLGFDKLPDCTGSDNYFLRAAEATS